MDTSGVQVWSDERPKFVHVRYPFLDRHPHGGPMILPRHKTLEIVEAISLHFFFSRFFFRDFFFIRDSSMGIVTSLANKGLANKG